MKHIYRLFLVLFISVQCYAQSVNDYKYVVVPEKFNFLTANDQHQLNSLTKFLFNKYGFEAYLNGEPMPFSINEEACKSLYADVIDDSGLIYTKLKVILKDCNDQIIFMGSYGDSKDKDYKRSYHEALREAFYDIHDIDYQFSKKLTAKSSPIKKEIQEKKGDLESNDNTFKELNKRDASRNSTINNFVSKDGVVFSSVDGFYDVLQDKDILIFKQGTKVIGRARYKLEESFPVTTSEFSGVGYFLEQRLIIQIKVPGVVELVEMIFTKNN